MCPGLTHPNAKMSPADKGTVVSVFAEGKEHPLAIGCTSMSTADIASKNKGIGIETRFRIYKFERYYKNC